MTVVISLLRGVNVGGHNKVKMEDLRTLYQSLDLGNPTTHIQSGNVLFTTKEKNLPRLAKRIADAIEQSFGVRTVVILRTTADLQAVIAANPFAARADVPPNKLVVTFLAQDPGGEAHDNLRKLPPSPEELHLVRRELYIYFPDGMGRSKLPFAAIDKALKTPGTARNWNTVTKLLELARKQAVL